MAVAVLFPAIPLTLARTEEVLPVTRTSTLHPRRAESSTTEAAAPGAHGFRTPVFLKILFSEVTSLHVELELPDVPETVVFPGVFGGHVLRARIP